MKAIQIDEFGDADVLRIAESPEPVLRPADLLVRVRAAGVNRADLTQRRGGYGRADFGDSTIMGLEVAGEVIAIGPEAAGFALGDRVMAVTGGGGYAEIARIDHRMAMPVPPNLSFIQAAAIPEVFITAHEALFHLADLQPGESVLIHAASGGVGSAAVQLAHAAGARVLATAQAGKLDRVRELGADIAIDHRNQDFAEVAAKETDGRGLDVIIDFIGAPYIERNIRSLAAGGRLIQVGLMGGGEAKIPLEIILFRHIRIIGTVMKSRTAAVKHAMTRRFRERWYEALSTGALSPVIDSVFPMADAAGAHRRMESGDAFGKIILSAAQ
ncbi:NAD(P)H-quinone oxidoreductase [Neoroseomonas lacus]|uniref:Oxidoreductase n=1 Tax=Neoroseomonas lacus TaxID=287609 RepID=A0A917KL75_9PROT|nr:NAD(P)H-quinone oxidoreductase [Neoroseomonas lacus]GGJ17130.1 oxidoreductase [Neoroseomonas lacus]